ncbi:MAG: HipA family kinase [Chloroflexota bacterium]
MIRTVVATDYIHPLREGGSLPAIVRANDGELYAMKFVGAGQGPKALIAELIGGEIARRLGFRMPEVVLMELDPAIGQAEPDQEIQDLLQSSAGLNLALAFLSESVAYRAHVSPKPTPEFAARLVWLDAFITNMDRTPRNVNLLVHQDEVWLIDHGAALYFHHNWRDHIQQSESRFPLIKEHVLLPFAGSIAEADAEVKPLLDSAFFEQLVNQIPDPWLVIDSPYDEADAHRHGYVEYLTHRLANSQLFVEEADKARLG